jgi:hypothetical protein
LAIDKRILAINADGNPVIYEPGAKLNAVASTTALMTNENNPKLKNVTGKKINFISGFKVAFKIISTKAIANNAFGVAMYIDLIR